METGSLIAIGTAGWSLPRVHADAFPGEGSHLERYARRLPAVEINSSFYRPHRPATYARWAASVPAGFRFAVKIPRTVTHERRLAACDEPLARFLAEVAALGDRLGPLLLQTPPSLPFEAGRAGAFLEALRRAHPGALACEPRHPSWFAPAVEACLADLRIARVAADPAPVPGAGEPGGWRGLVYRRLHGSPRTYHSPYHPAALDRLAADLAETARRGIPAWCIFDNTADFAAAGDALATRARLTG
ncbi:DUF72 domain-containing protein [Methylobacterium nigriterrae]|uniref:DUF72 domain-containing protein n=1 Tax=Methylobacterium nigriterrae TaxID=3127512 RepID=UPI003014137D